MNHYLAGYYLILPKPIGFGPDKGKLVLTCSACINDTLLNSWAYSWTSESKELEKEVKASFQLTDKNIEQIKRWVDEKYEEGKIGWADVFSDQETAQTYRQQFFSHLFGVLLLAVYLNEEDTATLINAFEPQQSGIGEMGIIQILKSRISEQQATNEETVGYDFIGVEAGGSFHSFYCNNVTEELTTMLHLTLNEWGLFEQFDNYKQIHDYLNDKANRLEPVPWVVAKIKRVQ